MRMTIKSIPHWIMKKGNSALVKITVDLDSSMRTYKIPWFLLGLCYPYWNPEHTDLEDWIEQTETYMRMNVFGLYEDMEKLSILIKEAIPTHFPNNPFTIKLIRYEE
jgi:hypothetical protein